MIDSPTTLLDRVRWHERQILRATDLELEQRDRLRARRRHNVTAHGWGIVCGLDLVFHSSGFILFPGLAIDGLGRELIFPAAEQLLPARLGFNTAHHGVEIKDLWLVYRCKRSSALHNQAAGVFDRWHETVALLCTPVEDPALPPTIAPAGVHFESEPFLPHENPPEDAHALSPVFLGRLHKEPAATNGGTHVSWKVESHFRRYAALVGAAVFAPSQTCRLEVGAPDLPGLRAFAVSLGSGGEFRDALSIRGDGRAAIAGDLIVPVDRCVRVAEPDAASGVNDRATLPSAPRVRFGVELGRAQPVPQQATPWTMRRAEVVADAGQPPPRHEELRIELQHPGQNGDPANFCVAIGAHVPAPPAGEFPPASVGLTRFEAFVLVRADGALELKPDVEMEVLGKFYQGFIEPDLEDPRFLEKYLDVWATSLGAILGTRPEVALAVGVSLKSTATPPTTPRRLSCSGTVSKSVPNHVHGVRLFVSYFRSTRNGELEEIVHPVRQGPGPEPTDYVFDLSEDSHTLPDTLLAEAPAVFEHYVVCALGDIAYGETDKQRL